MAVHVALHIALHVHGIQPDFVKTADEKGVKGRAFRFVPLSSDDPPNYPTRRSTCTLKICIPCANHVIFEYERASVSGPALMHVSPNLDTSALQHIA